MAISQTDVDNLEQALMSGALRVEIEGKSVTYRSSAELREALAYARERLQTTGAATMSVASFTRD